MDIASLKNSLVAQLQAKVGLDEAKARQAADVVEKLISEHGAAVIGGVKEKLPAGAGDALGGWLGKK